MAWVTGSSPVDDNEPPAPARVRAHTSTEGDGVDDVDDAIGRDLDQIVSVFQMLTSAAVGARRDLTDAGWTDDGAESLVSEMIEHAIVVTIGEPE